MKSSYKFNCGCIITQAQANKQRASKEFRNRLKCHRHPSEMMVARVGICPDCGKEYDFCHIGKEKERCDPCTIKHKLEYDFEYHKVYLKTGPKKRYKKGPLSMCQQPPDHNTKTDLKPNPVITNPNKAPCFQGPCQLAAESKNNTACIRCAYRSAYVGRVKGFYAPGIVVTQHIPERSHIMSV